MDWDGIKRKLVLLAIFLGIAGCWWNGRPIRHPPGILIPENPVQGPPHRTETWQKGEYIFKDLASFRIKARVLHAARYYVDETADLCPVDLALGWGRMSDQAIIDKLDITQDARWYEWYCDDRPPIPVSEIASHSANMHLIPSTGEVERQIKKVRAGQIVEIEGNLVLVNKEKVEGWKWKSSMSRTDTDGGACEVIWVESIAVIQPGTTAGTTP